MSNNLFRQKEERQCSDILVRPSSPKLKYSQCKTSSRYLEHAVHKECSSRLCKKGTSWTDLIHIEQEAGKTKNLTLQWRTQNRVIWMVVSGRAPCGPYIDFGSSCITPAGYTADYNTGGRNSSWQAAVDLWAWDVYVNPSVEDDGALVVEKSPQHVEGKFIPVLSC